VIFVIFFRSSRDFIIGRRHLALFDNLVIPSSAAVIWHFRDFVWMSSAAIIWLDFDFKQLALETRRRRRRHVTPRDVT
jgi:hypothetical protein